MVWLSYGEKTLGTHGLGGIKRAKITNNVKNTREKSYPWYHIMKGLEKPQKDNQC